MGGKKAWSRQHRKTTDPEVGDGQGLPESRVDHVDQVLPVRGDEGAVVWRQTHGLGLLVAHAVGRVQPHHVPRVGLVQRHQVELGRRGRSEEAGDLSNEPSATFLFCIYIQTFTHSLRNRANSFHRVSSDLISNFRLKRDVELKNNPSTVQNFQTQLL